jgi:MFS transporter, DHA2 family, multidrug resistance protein
VTTSLPTDVPPEAVAVARDTLGAATGVADQLPDALATILLEVARGAFVHGMQVAAGISVVVAIGVAILAVVMLRDVPPNAESDADVDESRSERGTGEPARVPAPRRGALQPEA